MNYNVHRRRTGLFIGLALGTGYSLTANLINYLTLPGIPLYTPPPGQVALILITVLMFGALGLVAAWTDEALPGVLLAGFFGSLVSSIWILINETNKTATLALLVLVFLPRMFFYLPFGALVRWLIYKLDQPTGRKIAPVRQLVPVFIAFIGLVFAGSFAVLPEETRTSLFRMEELLKTGMQSQATSRTELPKSLQSVEGFIQNARGEYSYTVGSDPDILPVQRPIVEYGELEPFI